MSCALGILSICLHKRFKLLFYGSKTVMGYLGYIQAPTCAPCVVHDYGAFDVYQSPSSVGRGFFGFDGKIIRNMLLLGGIRPHDPHRRFDPLVPI